MFPGGSERVPGGSEHVPGWEGARFRVGMSTVSGGSEHVPTPPRGRLRHFGALLPRNCLPVLSAAPISPELGNAGKRASEIFLPMREGFFRRIPPSQIRDPSESGMASFQKPIQTLQYPMKTYLILSTLALLGATAHVSAQSLINVDFGTGGVSGTYTGSGPLGGGTWNAVTHGNGAPQTTSASALKDSTGATTAVGLNVGTYNNSADIGTDSHVSATMRPLFSDYFYLA